MLIFDRFPDLKHADDFAISVRDTFALASRVCDSQEPDQHDPFPFELQPPIVLVQRSDAQLEYRIQAMVKQFSGEFAGT